MTAQAHELLIYEGEMASMTVCPPLPAGHPRLVELPMAEALKEKHSSVVFSTACWRGYLGTWEIKDGRLYLNHVEGRFKLTGEGPLPADWFSGAIRIPRGELLRYVHMGFESVYEREIHVELENGRVTGSRVIDNRGRVGGLGAGGAGGRKSWLRRRLSGGKGDSAGGNDD